MGEIRNTFYTPGSFSFDPTDTILTINYTNLPSDAYQFTLVAGPSNFLSLAGVPLAEQLRGQLHDAGGHQHPHRPPAG